MSPFFFSQILVFLVQLYFDNKRRTPFWDVRLFVVVELGLTLVEISAIIPFVVASVAHLVERHLAKVEVASSSLVTRSM